MIKNLTTVTYSILLFTVLFFLIFIYNKLRSKNESKYLRLISASLIFDLIYVIIFLLYNLDILKISRLSGNLINGFYWLAVLVIYLLCFKLFINNKKFFSGYIIVSISIFIFCSFLKYLYDVQVSKPIFYTILLVGGLIYLIEAVKNLNINSKIQTQGFVYTISILTPVIFTLPFIGLNYNTTDKNYVDYVIISVILNFLSIIFMYYCFYKSIKFYNNV